MSRINFYNKNFIFFHVSLIIEAKYIQTNCCEKVETVR